MIDVLPAATKQMVSELTKWDHALEYANHHDKLLLHGEGGLHSGRLSYDEGSLLRL